MVKNSTLRRYPVGEQSFENIRRGDYVYIDKTAFIYKMAHEAGKYFFLSRPRRFGKSLLISTIQCYFEGKRELFQGLAIEEKEEKWETYPVLRIDFSSGKYVETEDLESSINHALGRFESRLGINKNANDFASRLIDIIQASYEQTEKQVVVLVDEYDAPLLDAISDPQKLTRHRNIMRGLFSPLKSEAAYLRFVLLTGISKFSQMSIFSELNNLANISMDDDYAAICGITEEELLTQMRMDIEMLADSEELEYDAMCEELKRMYDGYHFSGCSPDIYNPFSLLGVFSSKRMDHFWFSTGTPTFLIELLKDNDMELADLDDIRTTSSRFDMPTEDMDDPVPVLYQSGYLTIKGYNRKARLYTLGIPNTEVRSGLGEGLFRYHAIKYMNGKDSLYVAYTDFVEDDDLPRFFKAIQTFLSGYPYDVNNMNERHYHAILYGVLAAFGADVRAEERTAQGRIEILLRMPKTIYVIELKYDRSADEALRQIATNAYTQPFMGDGRRVMAVGVNIDSTIRNISEWKMEDVSPPSKPLD